MKCSSVSQTLAFLITFGAGAPCAQAQSQELTDRYGDPLPAGALARLGSSRFRHGANIAVLAASPDGKTLASSGHQYHVTRLWNAATGKELRRRPPLHGIDFAPDSKTLAAVRGDGTILIVDVASDRELRQWPGHKGGTNDVKFSPDGNRLASAGNDGTVRVWQVATGKQLLRMEGHLARTSVSGQKPVSVVSRVAFSPDGKMLASGGIDGTVRVWDAASGKELHAITGHAHTVPQIRTSFSISVVYISAVVFSPDGKMIASASHSDKAVRLWDARTGMSQRTFEVHPHGADCIVFAPDGKMLASGGGFTDGLIRLWDPASGKLIRQLTGHRNGVSGLAFLKGGQVLVSASGGWDGTIRLWDAATGKDISPGGGHKDVTAGIAFAPDGKTLASASWDGTVRLWEPDTGRELRRLEGHRGEASSVAFAPDGKLLASGSVYLYGPGSVRLWDAATGKQMRRLPLDHGARRVLFTPDGKRLAIRDNMSLVHLWDVTAGAEPRAFAQLGLGTALAISPEGRFVAADSHYSSNIHLYELATGRELYRLKGKGDTVSFRWFAFSPDGKTLAAAGSDGGAHLWEVASGKERRHTGKSTESLVAVAFSPSGRLLALGTNEGNVQLRDVFTGNEIHCFRGHAGSVHDVAFDPRGQRLASASYDTTILVWDVDSIKNNIQLAKPAPKELIDCWNDLANDDAVRAFQAIGKLVRATEDVVPWLGKQLDEACKLDPHLAQLVADLDSKNFAVRDKANAALARMGALAEPELRRALGQGLSLETRRRVQQLLDRLNGPITHPQVLRILRAIEVLEQRGSADARRILTALAGGAPGAWRTQAAQDSLHRLRKQYTNEPGLPR